VAKAIKPKKSGFSKLKMATLFLALG
jgi:hypothetical protein